MNKLWMFGTNLHACIQEVHDQCGTARTLGMASLAVQLLDIYQGFATEKSNFFTDLEPYKTADVRRLGTETRKLVGHLADNHKCMSENRPLRSNFTFSAVPKGFHFSTLHHLDASAQATEQQLYQWLGLHLELPDFGPPAHPHFPLLELCLTLSQKLEELLLAWADELEKKQDYSQQRRLADASDPLLNHYLQRSIDAGFLNTDGTWKKNITKSQIALWVDLAARKLSIKKQWKWAKDRWEVTNLATFNSRNQQGEHVPRRKDIEAIFKDDD